MSGESNGSRRGARTGSAIVCGAGAGLVFGAALGNAGVGMVLGAALGAAFPTLWKRLRNDD